jgi:glycosyltransferase involved in cell wall biosynthesis
MCMSKVDVIIPTYNRAEFLQAAIGSVLNQSFRDFTLLVVDDASADGESF